MKNLVAYIWWTIVEKIASFCYERVRMQNHRKKAHHEMVLLELQRRHDAALKAQEWSEAERIRTMTRIECDEYYLHSGKRTKRDIKWSNITYKARRRKSASKYGKI